MSSHVIEDKNSFFIHLSLLALRITMLRIASEIHFLELAFDPILINLLIHTSP